MKSFDAEAGWTAEYVRAFDKAIANEDLTGALIRGHLYVESEMASILVNAVPFYDKISPRQLMFEAKVEWLRGMALIAGEERRALQKLNELRNSVAHITKPGIVPALKLEKIAELREALSPSMLDVLEKNEVNGDDPGSILRRSLIAIVVVLHVRSEATSDELGVDDVVRYHLTGETVQQRIEAAMVGAGSDSAELKTVKDAIQKLTYDNQRAIRVWMRERYHS